MKKLKKFLEKLKKFILKNKLLSVLLFLLILILILLLVIIKVFIFPSYKVSNYGNRLDGIADVKLSDSRFDDVKNKFNSVDGFKIDKFRLSGKIVNIFVTIDDKISMDKVKSSSLELIKLFDKKELEYYDFQVFVTGGKEDKDPMIGYKNKNSEDLYWNYEGEK